MTTATATVRLVQPLELASVARLVNTWSSPTGEYDLRQTFPQIYGHESRANLFGLFEGNRLLSHMAVYEVQVVNPHGEFRSGLIGAVATDPECRGRGLASALLSQVLQLCERRGLDASMLWSDPRGLYGRFGFQPAGRQIELLIESRGHPGAHEIREADVSDTPAILTLHETKPLRVRRGYEDMALLLSIPGMTTVVLERDGAVIAYACLGKGVDFPGWWHEMGGSDADVSILLSGAMEMLCQNRAMVLVPPYRTALKSLLGDRVVSARMGGGALRLCFTARGDHDFFIDGLDSI